jgi:hypothetical protein
MRIQSFLLMTMFAVAPLAGCGGGDDASSEVQMQAQAVDMAKVKSDLEKVASARILLGHQSVGRDVLAGLRSLAAEIGTPLRIVEIDGLPPDDQPGVFSNHIGENGDPAGKCEAFSHLLTRSEQPKYDVAMMKFCYADLREGAPMSADEMLGRYTRLTGSIREQRPDVRLVHVTMPLKAEPVGRKTWLKRKLGMTVDGDDANAMRHKFNEGLRARYGNEPMLDLAALESTLPDGTRATFEKDGQTIQQLARMYTHDGGHLNETGQRRAAIEFVRTVASALDSST